MVYGLEDGKSVTHTLQNPKTTTTTAAVTAVMITAISNQVIKKYSAYASDVKDIYIKQVERNF